MSVFSFPAQVNERAARLVAAVVAVSLAGALVGRVAWLVPLMAVGFVLRVGWGPAFSPLARGAVALASFLWAPRPVFGKPKRFAQAIGAVCTLGASALLFAGQGLAAWSLVGLVVVFALLEASLGFCAGCWLYARLQALGVFGADVCVDCAPTPRAGVSESGR
ncbi:MAG: DUF4395 domain-containing protein [Deltaproteobacteria bacterium]|nr:DUF4395 domain-containing protein [Deltaproteobacteria bacterium]